MATGNDDVRVRIGAQSTSLQDELRKAETMIERFARSGTSAFSEVNRAARAEDIGAYGSALDDLRAKYNPLFAASRSYKASLDEINRALRVGAISEAEHAAALARTKAAFAGQVTRLRGMEAATVRSIGAFRAQRGALQQVGFQVGDFATQLASGQNAVVAFTQQGSQMLQVFGPWGAILGAGVAVAGALGIAMFGLGQETEKTKEALDDYAASQSRVNELLLTAEEASRKAAVAKRGEQLEITRKALAVKQEMLAEQEAEVARFQRMQQDLQRGRLRASRAITELGGRAAGTPGPAELEKLQVAVARTRDEIEGMQAELEALVELDPFNTPADQARRAAEETREYNATIADTVRFVDGVTRALGREAEKRTRQQADGRAALDGMIAGLRAETEQIGLNSAERQVALTLRRAEEIARRAGIALSSETRAAIRGETEALIAKTDAEKGAADAARAHRAALDRMRSRAGAIFEATRTPLEQYQAQIEELNRLRALGAERGGISEDTYARAVKRSQDELQKAKEATGGLAAAAKDLGLTFSSAFEDAIVQGEGLRSVMQGLLQDILRIAVRRAVTEPLMGALSAGLSGVFSAGLGSLFGGGGLWQGAFNPANADFLHSGGIAGASKTPSRLVSPLAFAGAPRLHGGGMVGPGEVPAILKRGEGVFTPEQMRALGGGGAIAVHIHNAPPGTGATARESRDANGGRRLDIVLDETMAQNVRPGTKTFRAIQTAFAGMSPALSTR